MTLSAATPDSIVRDPGFRALSDYVTSATGLVFFASRAQALARHVGERLDQLGFVDCRAYLNLLQDCHLGDSELNALAEMLTVGETFYFRHQELFVALRDAVLPEIVARNRATRQLRIWSAGCSNGAEAYSLAILLQRDLSDLVEGWNISIVGTDINRTFLEQALAGDYEEWAFRGNSPALRRECFEKHGNTWRIAPRYRQCVSFKYQNLASQQPYELSGECGGAWDLILCRNVLIYFAPEFSEQVVSRFAQCLAPEGWLAVGHAEHGTYLQAKFEAVGFPGATVYRKRADSTALKPSALPPPNLAEPLLHGAHFAKAKRTIEVNGPGDVGKRIPVKDSRADWPQIIALADAGDATSALTLCNAHVASEPLDPVGHFHQALLLELQCEYTAALRALRKAIYLDRRFVLAHYHSGVIHERLGNTPEARVDLRNVLALTDGQAETDRIPLAGDLAVAELRDMTRMHLEALEAK